MTITNKNDANKTEVLDRLSAVRSALKNEPQTPPAARALEQCDRLELAIRQFHAEGLRFAAFTLFRTVFAQGTAFTEPVHIATQNLKSALETAGYPH
ncbi:MAG TPA: hypothetical protein VFI62_04730 [Burkholderiales bacterium]|nr:hypothetical protein [Burkholderiales bacterium]